MHARMDTGVWSSHVDTKTIIKVGNTTKIHVLQLIHHIQFSLSSCKFQKYNQKENEILKNII